MHEGIGRANSGTPDEVKKAFDLRIEARAHAQAYFTVDDVRNDLERDSVEHEAHLLGLGAAFQRAVRLGLIERTNIRGVYSVRPQHHRELTVWHSLVAS